MNFDSSVLQVAIEDIIPNRFQPRLSFEDTSLNELAQSIKQHGIIQPLVLRKTADKYEIIAGERRYKAAILAGLVSVPAVIAKIDDKTSAEVAIVENVQRRQLSAIEEARSYKALLDQGYMTTGMLADKMGITETALNNKLKLLNLSPEVQQAIMDNKISERHGRSLLKVDNLKEQVEWLNKIISERIPVRQLDEELNNRFRGYNMNNYVDINQVKQNATDISVNMPTSQVAPTFTMGPIDLGQKTTNKFFNSLEDQAVNMQMTEAINPYNQPMVAVAPQTAPMPVTQPSDVHGFTTAVISGPSSSLDSLDYMPPVSSRDITPAINKINNLLNELKAEYNIDYNEVNENGQVVYTIIVRP